MRERIRFLVLYFLFWVVFFIIARVLFLAYHIDNAKLLTLETVFGVFSHGIKLDLAMAGYFSLLPFLWVTISNFINKAFFQWAIFTYTFFLLIITSLIIIIDFEVYNIWNFRLDVTPLKYLTSPREAFLTLKNSPILRLALSFIILMFAAGTIVYRIVSNKIYDWKHIKNFPFIIYGLLLTTVLIIPIRGGIGSDPLNLKSIYFSQNYFANISTLNTPWNLGYSIINRTNSHINPYNYLPREEYDNQTKALFKKSEDTKQVVQSVGGYPNIILIMVENLSKSVIDTSINGVELTPKLNQLKRKGIYFSNFYATGSRSDNTIPSTLSGFPSIPAMSILDQPKKLQNLPVISRDLNGIGYSTSFYYGGDADFLGIKQYLFNGNYEKIIEKVDFPKSDSRSSMGYSDRVVYDKFISDYKQISDKPFFSTILTLSSHEPFDLAADSLLFEPNEPINRYYNAIHYADQSLFEFLEKSKNESWWNNTLVIIMGNHGYSSPGGTQNINNYEVPMIWTGGAIRKAESINKPFSQSDLVASILSQLHLSADRYVWSKNIFDAEVTPWAFLTFNNGFGYIDKNSRYLFDNIGEKIINGAKPDSKSIETGKALQQKSYQYFLDL